MGGGGDNLMCRLSMGGGSVRYLVTLLVCNVIFILNPAILEVVVEFGL